MPRCTGGRRVAEPADRAPTRPSPVPGFGKVDAGYAARVRAQPPSPSAPAGGAGPRREGPRLRAADGTDLATRCWLSAGGADALVVIAHGFTANKDDPKVVALAEWLHGLGYDAVAFDSRGHGRSGGECTLGKLEVLDVDAVVAWARTRTDRVVLVGASMGAVGVLAHAAADPDLVGVVTVSSPARGAYPSGSAPCSPRPWPGRRPGGGGRSGPCT